MRAADCRHGHRRIPPALAGAGLLAACLAAAAEDPKPGDAAQRPPPPGAPEVVAYASELPGGALSEFDVWKEPASPGGKMVGTPNTGDKLNAPPEEDPHVKVPVRVERGVAYRCWIHMKVGAPMGVSQANRLYVQFSDAVDQAGKDILEPGTGSYLTAQGPERQGWVWTSCDAAPGSSALVRFKKSGEVTVRLQAGMEGVGFDQVVLSPARFLDKAPTEATVKK